MDYEGLDYRNIRYPVNRELTDEERAQQYKKNEVGNQVPMDFLSVIKFNSSYIELVDRWYSVKGFNVWLGTCVLGFGLVMSIYIVLDFFFLDVRSESAALWFMLIFFLPIGVLLILGGAWLVRTEAWRWTHYPMRLNRKTRQVYVFRQNGAVLTVSWDDLFIVRGVSKSPVSGTTYDLRAHVLDADGKTVLESFSLGYALLNGNEQSIDKFWAFLQPYMEAPDGVERTYRYLKETGYLLPIDGRKEGWRWSITCSFFMAAHWPWLQLLGSFLMGANALGRLFAMWTSKVPYWPDEVEKANPVEKNDPFVVTWRENFPLGWWELWWPLLCMVIGLGGAIVVMTWLLGYW